jgi:hypothetical protein
MSAASDKLRRPRGFAAAHPMRIADGRTLTRAPRHCTPVLVAMPTAVWCLRQLRQYDLRSLRSCSISAPSSILSLCDSRDAFRSAMYELVVRSLRCAVQRATCNVQRATCNVQRATCNVQFATCNVQRATCNVQRATDRTVHFAAALCHR